MTYVGWFVQMLFEDGRASQWVVSDEHGYLAQRPASDVSRVAEAIKGTSLAHPANVDRFAAIARRPDGSMSLLREKDVDNMVRSLQQGKALPSLASLHAFVHPRSGDGTAYRCHYTAGHRRGESLLRITRVPGALAEVEGVDGVTESACTQAEVVAALEPLTESMVHAVEVAASTTVESLSLEFAFDPSGRTRLLSPLHVTTSDRPSTASTRLGEAREGEQRTRKGDNEQVPDWAMSKAREFEAMEAAREEEQTLRRRFAQLEGKTVGDGQRGHVLLCDAEAEAVIRTVDALVDEGFTVTVVSDGSAAVSQTRLKTFDVLLLGIDIPSLSGIEVTRIIRQREASLSTSHRLPVIAFTADTEPDDLRQYMNAEMDGCICKPLDIESLLNTIQAAIPESGPPSEAQLQRRQEKERRWQQETETHLTPGMGGLSGPPVKPRSRRGAGEVESKQSSGKQQEPYASRRSQRGGGDGGPPPSPLDGSMSLEKPSHHRATLPPAVPTPTGQAAAAASSFGASGFAPRAGDDRMGDSDSVSGQRLPSLSGRDRSSLGPPLGKSGVSLPAAPMSRDGEIHGVYQVDAETAIPYCILGKQRDEAPLFHFVVCHDLFDTMETYQIFFRAVCEKYPGLRVLLWNYPGQAFTEWRRDALLNNEYLASILHALLLHVGSAGTNEFGLKDGQAPFYTMGYGLGGGIATYFANRFHGMHPNLRALLLINGAVYVDAHLASVLHDCMNVFAVSPPSRPDLPVYFVSRFLFSPQYLAKVGAPLALNLYTAVHNPISLEGRIQLCKGALGNVDCRDGLESLPLPVIVVTSAKDGFVKPAQAQKIVETRGGEERSLRRALKARAKCCVIWLRTGHEVWQEARRPMTHLIEQLGTGYHERNDVDFHPLAASGAAAGGSGQPPRAAALSRSAADRAKARSAALTGLVGSFQASQRQEAMQAQMGGRKGGRGGGKSSTDAAVPFEDQFLDNVVSAVQQTRRGSQAEPDTFGEDTMRLSQMGASTGPRRSSAAGPQRDAWPTPGAGQQQYPPLSPMDSSVAFAETRRSAADGRGMGTSQAESVQWTDVPPALQQAPPTPAGVGRQRGSSPSASTTGGRRAGDASQGNNRKTQRSKRLGRGPEGDAEVAALEVTLGVSLSASRDTSQVGDKRPGAQSSEYMQWRVRRNQKRLQRIEGCAMQIQRSWRAYLARTLVARMRQQRAALNVERWWRGCLGRAIAERKRDEIWAAKLVQRHWRGYMGRVIAWRMKTEEFAATMLQRVWRGSRSRHFVNLLREARASAVTRIQAVWRRRQALKAAWELRDRHNAAVNVQRVWRGYLGRARALREREKYLFSKSQSQGIEFGRQMLLEHKLHGTKLQSEVSLLTKEKLETEEAVESVLAEIASFENGVRALEKQMLELSRAEAEAAGTLDEESKTELRENKMRLDREFGSMLVKIADRREKLQALERRLQALDRTRQSKKEELADLERKLVVLLEEQQRELASIKVRQSQQGEQLVEDSVKSITGHLPGQIANGGGGGNVPGRGPALQLTDGSGRGGGGGGNSQALVSRQHGGGNGAAGAGGGGGGGGDALAHQSHGPSAQERAEANALLSSTETMMKFGFMSMSLTYFSSLNMVRAMRKVGAANTVLANPMAGGGNLMDFSQAALGATGSTFQPGARSGETSRSDMDVEMWTVADVSSWLETMALGQYRDSFADAAVDGAFLFDLTDEDLRNTLGIEHALHRKKILTGIRRLKHQADRQRAQQHRGGGGGAAAGGGGGGGGDWPSPERGTMPQGGGAEPYSAQPTVGGGGAPEPSSAHPSDEPPQQLRLDELISWVRHNKGRQVADALRPFPDVRFDKTQVAHPFVPGYGTQYEDALNRQPFHINKADDFGNTALLVAAQNGNLRLAKLLVRKGANVDHQNNQGQTALHYAMAYEYHDLGEWLANPDAGAADDTLLNQDGLTPYDGLAA